MELQTHKVEVPEGVNVILGQSHFIKTAEDLYEVLVNAVPNLRFGLAFCESSGPRLIRHEGTDSELRELAAKTLFLIGAGHSFLIYLKGAYPINVLNSLKNVPEVCNLYCATANPLEVIVAQSEHGRGILGVIDGTSPLGIETQEDIHARREFVRKIGYKLG